MKSVKTRYHYGCMLQQAIQTHDRQRIEKERPAKSDRYQQKHLEQVFQERIRLYGSVGQGVPRYGVRYRRDYGIAIDQRHYIEIRDDTTLNTEVNRKVEIPNEVSLYN